MSLGVDQEILEDFLVEAGEILEQLSEQLVDLEQRPNDKDLLNAIFRGFHTVKGGAGFLQLEAMVECCHKAENLFDMLRNGELSVNADLMDVVLQSLDAVNVMFDAVRNGIDPPHAEASLMNALDAITSGQAPAAASAPAPAPAAEPVAPAPEPQAGANGSNEEFDMLLGDLQGAQSEAPAAAPVTEETSGGGSDDLITEDEFEALLDELHGKGGSPTAGGSEPAPAPAANSNPASGNEDLISEDEFEALLDDLQAQGKGPSLT